MAIITYYKAVSSTSDGSKGALVTSGQIDAILPYLTSQQRITGITQLEKFYVQSDTTMQVFIGFTSLGLFNATMITSTGAVEVAGDVLPATARFGASEILSNTASGCVIKDNPVLDLYRAGDYILVGDVVVQIDTITATGSNRTIEYLFDIPYVDLVGTKASSTIQVSLTKDVAVPFWVENIVAIGSPATQTYNTVPLVIVS